MNLACAAVVASLCLPQTYVAVTDFSAMYRTETHFDAERARRTNTEIVFWRSDGLVNLRPEGMPRACAGDRCVYYQKHCDEVIAACSFVVSDDVSADTPRTARVAVGDGFSVHAPSRHALERLLHQVRFIVHGSAGEPIASVALESFDQEGGEFGSLTIYRPCLTTVRLSGCPPLAR
jgi:hypothetical protein